MLSADEVVHIAKLARVGMTADDVARFQVQLSQILEQFEKLGELDTAKVPPTRHAIPLQNVMRDDVPAPSYPPEEVLANAPQLEEGSIRVRAVLEN